MLIHNWRRYLSFKVLQNWRKFAVLNSALCCGAIWCRNMSAQLQSLACTTTQIYFGKLSVGLFVRTNLFFPSHFCTTCTNFDKFCERYIAARGKKMYRWHGVHISVPGCNVLRLHFLNSLSYLHEVVRKNVSVNFWKIVASTGDGNGHSLVQLKRQSLLK